MKLSEYVKKSLALLIDLLLSFFILGYLVAWLAGTATSHSFSLSGWTEMLTIFLVYLYFISFDKYFGGTIGKRLIGQK